MAICHFTFIAAAHSLDLELQASSKSPGWDSWVSISVIGAPAAL